jgi:hypothetical protein
VSNPCGLDTTGQGGGNGSGGGLSNAVALCSHPAPELVLNAYSDAGQARSPGPTGNPPPKTLAAVAASREAAKSPTGPGERCARMPGMSPSTPLQP